MRRHEVDRLGMALAVLALLSPLFGLSRSSKTNFVAVHHAGIAVFLVVGLLALAGFLAGRAGPVRLAGVVALVAGLVQLAQFGRSTNWVAGNGSTFTLLLGLAIGLLVTSWARGSTSDAPELPAGPSA